MKLKNNFLPVVLLLAAIICFCFVGYFIWQRFSPQTIAFESLPVLQSIDRSVYSPNGLGIPSLNISLPIENHPRQAIWPVSSTGVIHINDTNIYYGHNWPNLLGKIKKISIGDTILIHTSSGDTIEYQIEKIESVWPNQPDILNQDQNTKIVLYTCTGFFDTKRLVIVASKSN